MVQRFFRLPFVGLIALLSPLSLYAYDNIQLNKMLLTPVLNQPYSPEGVAIDRAGRVWATDTARNYIVVYSTAGGKAERIGQAGTGLGEFGQPHGIAADAEGLIYVADTSNNRIQVFGQDGKARLAFGDRGSGPGQLRNPWGVAITQDGVVVVADRGNERLQLFSKNGIFLHSIESAGEVEGVAVDVMGRIYVLNAKTHQVDQWSSAGQLLRSFNGADGSHKPFGKPSGVAVNSSGLIYVSDRAASQIRELDSSGHTIGFFGRSGSGDGDFKAPAGLAVSGDSVYIADPGNQRIAIFTLTRQTPIPPLTPAPAVRVQVSLKNLWPVNADSLAVSAEGYVLALRTLTGDIGSYDRDGKLLSQFNTKQSLALKSPAALTSDPTGNLYITDSDANRVVKSDGQGGKLAEFGQKNSMFKGGQGELSGPSGIYFGRQNVYVADTNNSRFQTFNDQGLFMFAAGEKGKDPGQLKMPVSVAFDNDRIYVADAANHKIVVFNAAGRFLREMGLIGGEALVNPHQVIVDREGNVYVLDAARGRVLVYDDQGVFVAGFGSLGKAKGFLDQPKAIALSEDGRLYVAEDQRIQVFRVVLLPPAPTHLTANPGEGYVELKWEAAKSRFPVKYVVYRNMSANLPVRLKETVETSIMDDSLAAQTTYTYSVVSQSLQGASSVPSAPVQAAALPSSNAPRLEIVSDDVSDVFSAHYKYYSRNSLAHVVLRNNGPAPLQKIKVSFAVQGFMDFPTEVSLEELHYKEQTDVALPATFNNKILEVSETTPIQAQIKVLFYQNGVENSVVKNVPFKLYSRNTIRWDRKERFAAFVTPNDPSILAFSRDVALPFLEAHPGAAVPESIRIAWSIFEGLSTYGMSYAPRPNNPYDRISLDSSTVDTLQFARETLTRKSGDCADVVALLASSLESMTVATCALDAPGHLFLMFDTGETDRNNLGFPESELVFYAGTYWVPVEATLLGSSFVEAWKRGADQYRRWQAQGKLGVIDVHQAWKTFEPATLPDTNLGIKAPSRQAIEEKFLKDWQSLVSWRWQSATAAIKARSAADPKSGLPWMDLGFLAVDYKRYDEAKDAFGKATADPATAAAAFNNLGNLALIQNDLAKAEASYKMALEKDPTDAGIYLNQARLYLKLMNKLRAEVAFNKAVTLDARVKERYGDVSALAP